MYPMKRMNTHPIKELIKEGMEERKILAGYNVSAGVAGAIGAIAHDAWMNPCDVVKQRLQVKGSPYVNMSYSSIIGQIYRNEGIRAFYLSFPTQMATNGNYTKGFNVRCNDFWKRSHTL